MIKQKTMRWAGIENAWERQRMLTQFSPENLKGRSHSEYLIVDEIIILKCMLQKYTRLWAEMIWFIT